MASAGVEKIQHPILSVEVALDILSQIRMSQVKRFECCVSSKLFPVTAGIRTGPIWPLVSQYSRVCLCILL